jgi:type I restriction-modification system DNA methylase subunit
VLVVYLTTESKLERARTSIRNFVADHLKKRDEKDAALVAFVSPSENTWRFSYVKMEYATVAKESGKVGVETRLTPARRFSYIVGEGESCHTAQTRFLNLLGDTGTDPLLASIEDAFSVEAVTKEFFTKYAELFGQINSALEELAAKDKAIRDEFASKSVNTVDFAKKLMGQIVFLYFLQKKGWLGVAKGKDWGTGPHDFLRRLANGGFGKYDNFFNDILETLFYDTLATDRGHEAWCDRFKCRIPFLNGGLFEPLGDYNWSKIDIHLPNRLFTNTDHVDEGVTGTGVLDVFDRYNFTVNEAEPLEKEVAIDPEMLGKVFENLIEENRRKGLGAFYTPREIVHYMCQESLINFLDKSVRDAKVDIPRGDIETFIRIGEQIAHYEAVKASYPIKMPKSVLQNAHLLDKELATITVCDPAVGSGAFPVGMMAEIVRARCSLTPYFNDFHERTPYHFKRHAIQNCLYGVDIDEGAVEIAKLRLWLSLVVDEEETKQIKPLPNLDFRIVTGNSLFGFPFKSHGLHDIEQLKTRFFDETDHNTKAKLKHEIDKKLQEIFRTSKQSYGHEVNFDFRVNFSEVFQNNPGFDICIANPPYGAKFSKGEKMFFLSAYRHQDYQLDSYLLFLERAFNFLSDEGTLAYIIPNPWLINLTLKKIRRFIFSSKTVDRIVHYSRKVFAAVVDTEVVIIQNKPPQNNQVQISVVTAPDLSTCNCVPQARWGELDGGAVNIFLDEESDALFRRLSGNTKLGDVCKIAAGVSPYEVGKGSPPQTRQMLNERVYDATYKKSSLYRPLLRGRDIVKYMIRWDGSRWIKYGDNLASPRKLENFDAKRKIVIRQTGDSLIAALDDSQFICMKNMHTINAGDSQCDLRYILGLINSALLNYFFQSMNPERGETLAEVKKEHVEKLPIMNVPAKQQAAIIGKVDEIMALKKKDTAANTNELEREIDFLVYEVFNLTPAEIELVERATAQKSSGITDTPDTVASL